MVLKPTQVSAYYALSTVSLVSIDEHTGGEHYLSDIRHWAFKSNIGENFVGLKVSYSDIRLFMISMFQSVLISNKPNIGVIQYLM
jgi:hypothetical protein